MIITYQDSFTGETITEQQALLLDEYYKVYSIEGVPKKKEYNQDGVLYSVVYYKESETNQEIFNMYTNIRFYEIREREFIGNFRKETEKVYDSDGVLKLISVEVYNADGKIIFYGSLDKDTNQLILKSVVKYIYDSLGNYSYYIQYNIDGSHDVMFEYDDSWRYNRSEVLLHFGTDWQNMGYYHNAEPMIPV